MKLEDDVLPQYEAKSDDGEALVYGQHIMTPKGGGTITHLCSDIDGRCGWLNVLLDNGEYWRGHESAVCQD